MNAFLSQLTFAHVVVLLLMVFVFVLMVNGQVAVDRGLYIEGIIGGIALPSPLNKPTVPTG